MTTPSARTSIDGRHRRCSDHPGMKRGSSSPGRLRPVLTRDVRTPPPLGLSGDHEEVACGQHRLDGGVGEGVPRAASRTPPSPRTSPAPHAQRACAPDELAWRDGLDQRELAGRAGTSRAYDRLSCARPDDPCRAPGTRRDARRHARGSARELSRRPSPRWSARRTLQGSDGEDARLEVGANPDHGVGDLVACRVGGAPPAW